LNEILSKATKWVDALHDAIDLVFPLEHDQLPLEKEPAKLKMTQKCMEACFQWRALVKSAMHSLDMPRRDEAFNTEFLTAMSGFRILANQMLPLSCIGNKEDTANSTKFVFSTLRELHEDVRSKRPAEETLDAYDWVLKTTSDAFERLNEILSESQKWENAYEVAMDFVYPLAPPANEVITSDSDGEVRIIPKWTQMVTGVEDQATKQCKAACIEWSDKVERALMTRPKSGEENLMQYLETTRELRLLANRMLPLKCMGNEDNLTNSIKFVLLTLREIDEKTEEEWEDKEMWQRIVSPEEAGNALVSGHTP